MNQLFPAGSGRCAGTPCFLREIATQVPVFKPHRMYGPLASRKDARPAPCRPRLASPYTLLPQNKKALSACKVSMEALFLLADKHFPALARISGMSVAN